MTAETGTHLEARAARRGPQERRQRVVGSGQRRACVAATSCGRSSSVGRVAAHLLPHEREVVRRVAPARARGVHDVEQHARALDVAQELQAQARRPAWAPSMMPGMSAATKRRARRPRPPPAPGESVVKG